MPGWLVSFMENYSVCPVKIFFLLNDFCTAK